MQSLKFKEKIISPPPCPLPQGGGEVMKAGAKPPPSTPQKLIAFIKILLIILAIPFIQAETFVIDPTKNAVWHNERGIFFLKLGNYLGAIQEFEIAIALNPNTQASASFYNNLGTAYYKLGVYDVALNYFQKAVNFDPNFLKYYQNLIDTYNAQKRLGNVAKGYEKILLKDKYNSSAYLMLGLINKQQGHTAQSIIYLSEYARLEPDLDLTKQIDLILKEMRQ